MVKHQSPKLRFQVRVLVGPHKNNESDANAFDDLFFRDQQDEKAGAESPRGAERTGDGEAGSRVSSVAKKTCDRDWWARIFFDFNPCLVFNIV